MVKKTFLKECLRSIRGSFSRFLAIFLIVALGAGFLAGLLATTPDMRHTVSELYRETNLYDLRIAGNLGLEEADLLAIAAVEGVAAVMPAKSLDRELSLTTGDTLVGRFHGVSAWEGNDRALINRSKLVEGRWPQSADECVIEVGGKLSQGGLDMGQVLTLLPPEDEDLEDDEQPEEPFTRQQFTIVGKVASGSYVSLMQRGSTSIGNGTVGCIVYVQEQVLDTDYYTDIYAVVEGGHNAEAFTQAYEDLVSAVQQAVENLAESQKHVRADRLRSDAQEELDEAKQELADKTAEGQQELADALKELEDGEQEYADGLLELADGEQELLDGRQELADALKELEDGQLELVDARKELEDGELEYADGLQELLDAEQKIIDGQKELDDGYVEIQDAKRELKKVLNTLEDGEAELDAGQKQLDSALAQLEAGQSKLDSARELLEMQEEQLEQGLLYQLITKEEYDASMEEIKVAKGELDAQQAQINDGKRELRSKEAELNDARLQLTQGWAEYQSALDKINDADLEYRQGLYELQLANEELDEGRQELADARAELDDGWKKYYDGVADLEEGWVEYYDGLQELADAEVDIQEALVELADARVELDDGWKEYEDGKLEFEEKIYDANMKIRDAQDQINDIDDPEWYVLTRGESNESYIFYDSDTEKVAAIAKVFPIFFFLVAALVASTTMTRMIDEDRGAIGTLKALGYSNVSIAGKYLLYATLACALGATVGLAVFLPLFPRVIAQAYSMMYNLPPLVGADHAPYILLSAGLILVAVLVSTMGALKGVLQDNAATLMRPKAPPAGKRILLERIRPVWRRMKFTHKVTARNLFRYKKRFFMTVIGITGCTALLVAGFGLRDSIGDIVQVQFTQLQNYNLTMTMKHDGDDVIDRDIAAILSNPDRITDYLTVHMESGEGFVPHRTTDLHIVVTRDPAPLTRFHTFRDRLTGQTVPFDGSGVILTEKAAKVLGVEVGGILNLRNQDEAEAAIPVSGICENYVQGYVFLTEALYVQAFGEDCVYDTVFAKAVESGESDRDALASALLESSNVTGVRFSSSTIETFDDMLSSIDYIIILLIVAAAALAFVVLYNLTNINICERQKEIATLKVLGFYRREVSGYIFRETLLLSLIGTAIGLAFGVVFHQFVVQTAEVDAVMFGRVVKSMSFVYSALLSLLFTLLVSLFMQKKLHRIDMVESLKAPE